jgi:hypothetical protein
MANPGIKNKGEVLAEILREYSDCYFFLHNTKDISIAERIMNEGFIFESQLPHSTDRVNPNEPIEITYFMFQRKDYGMYTMVIAIPKATYDLYSAISNQMETGIEEIMTITDPWFGDNDELIYTISPRHILGYFNIKTSEFIKNKNWDRDYDNCHFRAPSKRLQKPDKNQ